MGTHRTCVQKPRRGEERGERLSPSFEAENVTLE